MFTLWRLLEILASLFPKAESWSAYIERLEQFFKANDISEGKQVATLLSVMGATTYSLLRNLVQPEKPKDKSYKDIVDTLKNHFEPKPLLIAERFRFNHCNQRADEMVMEYAAELKQCAVSCEFGATLDEASRDRFVSGIRNEACQRRLLSESNLTFARAFEIALSMESKEQRAFGKCKDLLTNDRILVHYDPSLPLTLACDPSAYGIGAVLQHTMPTGEERPVAYASRTLSPAEKKYSQIEKEGLALIFGVKKFHQYLWGRKFKMVTDHKPLLTLFGEHKSLPTMAAARIQRWAIILSAYDYYIEYCPSEKHGNEHSMFWRDGHWMWMKV